MITVRNLSKKYKSYWALKNISIHVNEGEIYGFIGKNGAGKSTTMNILSGLSKPDAGVCIVNGRDVTKVSHPSELNIGYLPEEPKFYPWLTAYETCEYLGNNEKRGTGREQILHLLEWAGLSEAINRKVGGFSRGMKQRLGLCSALINDPQIIILDEPSSALDPQGRNDVMNLIRDLKNMNKTVILSSHILSDVERVCDTIGIIADGRMIIEGKLDEIQKRYIHPVFDITFEEQDNLSILEKMKKAQDVVRIESLGDKLSVYVKETQKTSVVLMRILAENEKAVTEFSLRKSTLEDIYFQEVNGQ